MIGAARRHWSLRRYRRRLDAPLDPDLALFSAYWHRGYLCNPRSIYEKAVELVPGLKAVWAVNHENADAMPDGVDFVIAGSRAYWATVAQATVFVNNVNFETELVKRPGTTHVMTHHGTPLKYMGVDLRDRPIAAVHSDYDELLRRCARWDYTVSSNEFSSEIWRRAYPVPQTMLEVGYPRNDALVDPSPSDIRRLREAFGIRPGQKAALYAPTYRDNDADYVARLDLARVVRELPDEWVILARMHHRYTSASALGSLHAAGRIIDVGDHPLPSDVMLAADVLITDYSSIMFDYAILDRPIVVHAPDWEQYEAERGTYFDLMAEPPGAVTRSEEELIGVLTAPGAGDAEHSARRAAFRQRFCSLEQGTAAEQVVQAVWPGRAG